MSLKGKLLLYFFIMSSMISIGFGVYYYSSTYYNYFKNFDQSQYTLVDNVRQRTEDNFEQLEAFITWLCLNQNLQNIIQRPNGEINKFDSREQQLSTNLDERFKWQHITQYIAAIFVVGDNGLIIKKGLNAYAIDLGSLKDEVWLHNSLKSNGQTIISNAIINYVQVPLETQTPSLKNVLPVFKYIKSGVDEAAKTGHMIAFISTDILFEQSNTGKVDFNSIMSFVSNEGKILFSTSKERIGKDISDVLGADYQSKRDGVIRLDVDGINKIVISSTYNNSKFSIIKEINTNEVAAQGRIIVSGAIFLIVLLFIASIILSIFLSSNITKPLNIMVNKVERIAKGDFSNETFNQRADELGALSYSIQNMEERIQLLINSTKQREAEKRSLEIMMLQSQINPHFLYNTLNSIKLMATIQGLSGISEMVTSLGDLLHATLSKTTEKITIREEIELLNSYLSIQEIRYKGRVKFHVLCLNEKIFEYKIIKFLLQPIVENAIAHGIDAKVTAERVSITMEERDQSLYISVWDDGIGMSKEKMNQVMNSFSERSNQNVTDKIGLDNVQRRIKLTYGNAYGLSFNSRMGEYTEVQIKIPIEPKYDNDK